MTKTIEHVEIGLAKLRSRELDKASNEEAARPGCMDAYSLPSRMNDTLYYPDGRVVEVAS